MLFFIILFLLGARMDQKLKILIQMQQFDDVIGEKEILTRELPEELSSMKQNLENANNQLAETNHLLEENLKTQKLKELEIRSNKDKIDKYKNQLLTIQTNKEYKALNSEVSHLESLNTAIDDNLIVLMEAEVNIRTEFERIFAADCADDIIRKPPIKSLLVVLSPVLLVFVFSVWAKILSLNPHESMAGSTRFDVHSSSRISVADMNSIGAGLSSIQ